MCDRTVDNYSHVLKLVPECYKAVNDYYFAVQLVPDSYITQEMFDKVDNICTFELNLRLKKCVIKLFLKDLLC